MVPVLFSIFAVLFLALSIGSIIFVVRCYQVKSPTGFWTAVPGIVLTLVFISFTIYFIRRVFNLV